MNPTNFLISYRTLRRLIGILGIALPFMCWAVNAFVNHLDLLNNPLFVDKGQTATYIPAADLKASISHFYYTTAGPLFTGVLITVAIFLFCYNGYPENKTEDRFSWVTDKRITAIAAICALGIIIFPTDSPSRIKDNIHVFVSSKTAGTVHLICATAFFLAMAVMSIVNFRRHPGKELITDAEGKIYFICGWGIVLCILLMAVYAFVPTGGTWLWGKFVYVMEVFMLLFFGIAWLVKGKSIPTEFLLNKIKS